MNNDIMTEDIALSMKRTLLMLAEKQFGVKITNVYVTKPDGTTVDETDKYIVNRRRVTKSNINNGCA